MGHVQGTYPGREAEFQPNVKEKQKESKLMETHPRDHDGTVLAPVSEIDLLDSVSSWSDTTQPLRVLLAGHRCGGGADALFFPDEAMDGNAERLKVEFQMASTLEEVLKVVAQQATDLILLNPKLPGSEPTLTLVQVREMAFSIPIILLVESASENLACWAIQQEIVEDMLVAGGYDTALFLRTLRSAVVRKRMEVELRKSRYALQISHKRFQHLMLQSADAVLVLDRDQNVLFANTSAEVLFRLPTEKLARGKFPYALVPGEKREIQIDRGDGSRVSVEARTVETSWHGEPSHLATMRDLTRHKESEEQLRLLHSAIRHTQDAVVIAAARVETSGADVVFTNRAFTQLTGYDLEEVLQGKCDGLLRHLPRALDSDGSFKGEAVCRRKDGSAFVMEIRCAPVLDRSGAITHHVSTLRDVTQQRQSEKALRFSEERYRHFFEDNLAGNFIVARDGRVLACNPSFAQMFGFGSTAGAQAVSFFSLFKDEKQFGEFFEEIQARQVLWNHPLAFKRADGQPVFAVGNIFASYNEGGELSEIKGYLVDVTERRRLEEQLRHAQRVECVGQAVGGVIHDFNNMLSVILGNVWLMMKKGGVSPGAVEHLDQIRMASERAVGFTRQLLIHTRQHGFEFRTLDLNTVVTNMTKLLSRFVAENISLKFDLAEGLPKIRADDCGIEQILMNLVINARDAMPHPGMLRVATGLCEVNATSSEGVVCGSRRQGCFVFLKVSDTGSGMPEDVQRHIFDPYFTTKDPDKGTGLGLSIVKSIVDQHEGWIEMQSRLGEGTTFCIFLPVAKGDAERAHTPSNEQASLGHGEGVLLVEDDQLLQQTTRMALESLGYRVFSAGTSQEALELWSAQKQEIELLVADVVIPGGITGVQLAAAFLKEKADLCVLTTSGYHSSAEIIPQVATRRMGFLKKPYAPQGLAEAIRKLFRDSN